MSPNLPKNASNSGSLFSQEDLANDEETLVHMFRRVCSDPSLRDRVVLKDLDREWTLGQLDRITEDLAKLFVRKFCCQVGSSIAIYMNKCAEYVFAYIAALKAGAAYLPLDISYPESLLVSVLNEAKPAVVCTSREHSANLPAGTLSMVLDREGSWMAELVEGGNGRGEEATQLPGDDQLKGESLAYVVYSSGTTGKPKGIQCPHRGAVISYKWRFRNYPYEKDDVEACNVFFVWEMFRPILQAIPLVIIPDSAIYDPALLCQFLAQNRVTRILFTPSLLEMLLDTQDEGTLARAFQHMRLVHLCGEVVTCALLDRFIRHFPSVRCLNLYSISECHDVAVADLNEFHGQKEKRQFAPVGKVMEGVRVLILDGMRRVPIGVPGQIYVAGPTLAIGYLNRAELNLERFVDIPAEYRKEIGADRMYKTGDWGYLLANSVLEICGRCDTTVRIRGYSVETQAIEANLLNLPSVRSCAVVSIGAEGEDKQLAAYIVLRDKSVTRKQLRAQLKRVLPFYMMPQFFIYVKKLPLLAASSKIDKKALPSVDYGRDVVEAEALPQTETERELAAIWMDVLHLGGILDIQESFFDLGGHSLLAARLLAKINVQFNTNLTIRDLFGAPTVYSMARLLDGARGRQGGEKEERERVSPVQTINLDQQVEAHDRKENVMDLHLRAFWRATIEWKKRFEGANVFLTGVTGFLGSHLLAELLQSSKTKIVCLVRESSPSGDGGKESVEQRLFGTMQKNGLLTETVREQMKERVRVVAGDIALVQFGLTDEHYHFLSYDIDVVLHAAAYVNLIYPYQALHGCNVIGTRNVIDFCLNNKLKPLHYVSTDAVFPSGLHCVDEDVPPENFSNNLTDGYGQSKYVAEQCVLRARDRGLPTVIYRLGNQSAPTNGTHWNDQDFTYLMLLAVIRLGKTPNLDWEVELTPVNFSARFIVRLLSELFCENAGKIFHLIETENAPKWCQFMNWLRAIGFELEQIETNEWIKMIKCQQHGDNGHMQQLQKLLEGIILDDHFQFTQSTFVRSNADKLLRELGWTYPSINESVVKQWIQKLIEKGTIEGPTREIKMLSGFVCILTGASEGIGEAIAKSLAMETGANLVLASRSLPRLEENIRQFSQFGGKNSAERFLAVKCDITMPEDVAALVKRTIERHGKIDVLINCAGLMYYTMAKRGYSQEWQKQIDVNVHGTTNMIGAILPHMVGRKAGQILTITSDAGKRAFPGLAVYSGTKFYLEGFIQSLRTELVEFGIKFTNIQPGDVATKLASRSSDAEARQKYDGSEAGHKILGPEDIAKSVLFILSQPQHVAINEVLIEPQVAPI